MNSKMNIIHVMHRWIEYAIPGILSHISFVRIINKCEKKINKKKKNWNEKRPLSNG